MLPMEGVDYFKQPGHLRISHMMLIDPEYFNEWNTPTSSYSEDSEDSDYYNSSHWSPVSLTDKIAGQLQIKQNELVQLI